MTKFYVRIWLKNLKRYQFENANNLNHAREISLKFKIRGYNPKIIGIK